MEATVAWEVNEVARSDRPLIEPDRKEMVFH